MRTPNTRPPQPTRHTAHSSPCKPHRRSELYSPEHFRRSRHHSSLHMRSSCRPPRCHRTRLPRPRQCNAGLYPRKPWRRLSLHRRGASRRAAAPPFLVTLMICPPPLELLPFSSGLASSGVRCRNIRLPTGNPQKTSGIEIDDRLVPTKGYRHIHCNALHGEGSAAEGPPISLCHLAAWFSDAVGSGTHS